MEFKGTKGEWYVQGEEYPSIESKEAGKVITHPTIANIVSVFRDKEEYNANAKLISCAPEMFEILKELVELKQLKFNDGEFPSKEYLERKPIAWEKAKEIVLKATTI